MWAGLRVGLDIPSSDLPGRGSEFGLMLAGLRVGLDMLSDFHGRGSEWGLTLRGVLGALADGSSLLGGAGVRALLLGWIRRQIRQMWREAANSHAASGRSARGKPWRGCTLLRLLDRGLARLRRV